MSKRLSQNICTLLMEHHCVVVPSLGGFVLEALPAHWDEVSQLAYPPSVELHFQEALSHQDGLLESAYARQHGISMRRARVMVEEEIRLIRNQLLNHRSVEMDGLGILELSKEGRLTFIPQLSDMMQSSAYGLSPASLPSIAEGAGAGSQELVASNQEEGYGDSSRYVHLKLSKKMLASVASVAIFVLALLPWSKSLERGKVATASFAPSVETSLVTQETSDKGERLDKVNPAPKEATKQEAEKTNSNNHAEQTSLPASQELQGVKTSEPVQGRYYIIIASEPSMQRIADHYRTAQKEMEEMQYLELCILPSTKMHKISVASFETQSEAYTYLGQLSKKHKSAWVLKG